MRLKKTLPLALALAAPTLALPVHSATLTCPISVTTTLTGSNNNSAATCQINAGVTLFNDGQLTNDFGKRITILGTFANRSGALFTNDEVGILTNSNILDNRANATLHNLGQLVSTGTLNNAGLLKVTQGPVFTPVPPSFTSSGTLNNSGTLTVQSGSNYNLSGTINNSGVLELGLKRLSDEPIDMSLGTVKLNLTAASTFTHSAAIKNELGHTQHMPGLWNNNGAAYNWGAWSNAGTLNNAGWLYNGRTFTNRGLINNTGVLNLNSGGRYDAGGTGQVGQGYDLAGGTIVNSGELVVFNLAFGSAEAGTVILKAGSSVSTESNGKLTVVAGHTLSNPGRMTAYEISIDGALDNLAGASMSGNVINNGAFNNWGTVKGSILANTDGLATNHGSVVSDTFSNGGWSAFTNHGSMTVYGTFTNAAAFTNHGSLSNFVSSGYNVNRQAFDNTGSVLLHAGLQNSGQITNSGSFEIVGVKATIQSTLKNSGTLTNAGSLKIRNIDQFLNFQLENTGTLTLAAGSTHDFTGVPIVNSGTLNLDRNFSFGAATSGTVSLNVGGTLNNTAALVNMAGYAQSNAGTLNNGSGASVSNLGSLSNTGTINNVGQFTNTGAFINAGRVNNAGTLTLAAGSTQDFTGGTLDNTGVLELDRNFTFGGAAAGTVHLRPGSTLDNAATLSIATGYAQLNEGTLNNPAGAVLRNYGTLTNRGAFISAGTVTQAGQFIQAAGLSQIDGNFAQTQVTIQGGQLLGTGAITATVLNAGGVVQGGTDGTPGTLHIIGSFAQQAGGTLRTLVSGHGAAQASLLDVAGQMTLDGTLELATADGFDFAVGDAYTLATFTPGSLNGNFSQLVYGGYGASGESLVIGGGLVLGVIYDNGLGQIQLNVAAVPEPAEWALLLAGLGLVGWMARRRRRGAAPVPAV